jgi:hypothetical protein
MADESSKQVSIPAELIERRIPLICGHKWMLDRDPAGIYGVQTFRFKEAVKRNLGRLPDDSCSSSVRRKPAL